MGADADRLNYARILTRGTINRHVEVYTTYSRQAARSGVLTALCKVITAAVPGFASAEIYGRDSTLKKCPYTQ